MINAHLFPDCRLCQKPDRQGGLLSQVALPKPSGYFPKRPSLTVGSVPLPLGEG